MALAIKDKIPVEPRKGGETVVREGLAGLVAMRQLMLFGLEGRKCVGRRVYP